MLLPAISISQATEKHDLVKQYGLLGTVVLTDCEALPSPDVTLLHKNATFLGPVSLEHLELVGQWLDKGAIVAIFSLPPGAPSKETLEILSILPRSRVGVLVDYSQGVPSGEGEALAEAVSVLRTVASHVLVRLPADLQAEGRSLKDYAHALVAPSAAARGRAGSDEFVQLILECPGGGWTGDDINSLHKAEVDVLCAVAQDAEPSAPEALLPLVGPGVDAADAFIACLRTDRPDGLFTTVVVDELGVALGLVYSNRDSIRASIACGRGVYYSRSKGGLWRKGDTSGAWQELVGMAFDCDVDALRITVRQMGEPPVFCHLNRRNCWRADKGLGALQRTLQSRKQSAPPGSYTARLFSDPELLRNKLVEEAQELSEAEEPDHVAAEAADLLFFALTRCVAAGVTLEEVEAHLDVRSLKLTRRPGNAKDYRIQAAQHILDKK